MRKTIMAALLLMLIANSCYGAVSEDIYVRKDVFDAKMEAFMAEIRLMNEQSRNEMRSMEASINTRIDKMGTRIDKLETRIDRLDTRIDMLDMKIDGVEKRMSSLEIMIYWILGTLSVAFAVLALAPYLKEIRKPSITLNDVRRLIEENNALLEKKFQM